MLIDGIYQIEGNERVEKVESKIDCGIIIATSYYHPETGELLRRDQEVQVDPKFITQAFAGKQ